MAQNLAIHGICNVILPYALAKVMLQDEQLRVEFIKTVVILLAFIAITSIYEFRMTRTRIKFCPAVFFPDQFDAFAQRRYNLTRIAGPVSARDSLWDDAGGRVLVRTMARLDRQLAWKDAFPSDQ